MLATTACRTNDKDIARWANTLQGPKKLSAVVTHDKFELGLRVNAALTLVGMKPREGQRIGIDKLVESLTSMSAAERQGIVSAMVPELVREIEKPPPTDNTIVDETYPYKDAAYAMLNNDGETLISDDEHKKQLKTALTTWAMADFSARMDDSSQKYGMVQVLRYLGADGVKGLPALIQPQTEKIDRLASLIADLGDPETKLAASKQLVKVAEEVNSDAWLKKKTPELQEANKTSGLEVDEKRFAVQLSTFQEEELLRVFASMKKIGQGPIVDFLVAFAADENQPEKRRAAALAALENQMDRKNESQAKKVLAIASAANTPDSVRDQALRRVGELPRKQVAEDLFKLFENNNWKVRWLAAELILKMSDTGQLPEFMTNIGQIEHMALTEPLRYGKLIGEMKGTKDHRKLVDSYATGAHKVPVRLSALGYYYEYGTKSDLAKVNRYAGDTSKVPTCAEDAKDCEWKCAHDKKLEDISTVGEFVQYCVKPAMEKRDEAPEKPEKKEDKTEGKK
jgi:hypothetical protein